MQLSIIVKTKPVDIFCMEVDDIPIERQVFLDGTKVPDSLAKIILLGLDAATEQYLDVIEECMKLEQLKL